jgi:hypothetical protein
MGSLYHQSLEYFYEDGKRQRPEDYCKIAATQIFKQLGAHFSDDIIAELDSYTLDYDAILQRCKEGYVGSDAIRTKDGKVPTNPRMTTGYKQAVDDYQLDMRAALIDNNALGKSEKFMGLSASYIYSMAWSLLTHYEEPEWFGDVMAIELEFSRQQEDIKKVLNQVKIPKTKKLFNGKVDMIVRDVNGGLVILDHKTGSEGHPPTELEVQHHEQLNTYAWAYYKVYGVWVDSLCIHHARSGKFVKAPLNVDIVEAVISNLVNGSVAGIEKGHFVKRHPTGYNTPCMSSGGKACAYISKCWPLFTPSVAQNPTLALTSC